MSTSEGDHSGPFPRSVALGLEALNTLGLSLLHGPAIRKRFLGQESAGHVEDLNS